MGPFDWPRHEPKRKQSKTEAKASLGMGGGAYEPRSSHPFGRWLEKHERRKEAMLTIPVTPKQPRKEGPHNRLAEEMADQELAESRKESEDLEHKHPDLAKELSTNSSVHESSRSLRKDQGSHLLFRRHHYMPTIGTASGKSQLEPGAYGKSPYKGGGLSNMANDPNVRN